MLTTSIIFDLETWGLCYFVENLFVYNTTIEYNALWPFIKKSMEKVTLYRNFYFNISKALSSFIF